MDFLYLVVMNNKFQYLDAEDQWGTEDIAWKYHSLVAFDDAKRLGGLVFLVFPNGDKMAVSEDKLTRR